MRVAFATLGCKVNHFESAAMEELFVQAGHTVVPFDSPADVYIVNTCTVTMTADKKSRQMIARAHALSPNAPILAVGCYSEISRSIVERLPGVQAVFGTEGRKEIVSVAETALIGKTQAIVHTLPFMRKEFEELSAVSDIRTRATLKIQDGCNRFCTYCAIPLARGALRSRSKDSCLRELYALRDKGYMEAVLTGIELSLYDDNGQSLTDLLSECADLAPMRIRLGSLDPAVVDERFADVCAGLPNFCRHFHLSLQSGSQGVLKRMKRSYSPDGFRKVVAFLRARMPEAGITTDVITGFPGETDEEYDESKKFIQEIAFSRLHVFPYSRRPGTKADAMPDQIPRKIKEARARDLIKTGLQQEESFIIKHFGSIVEVLAEEDGTGYSGNYIRVQTDAAPGSLVRIKITGLKDQIATGEEI